VTLAHSIDSASAGNELHLDAIQASAIISEKDCSEAFELCTTEPGSRWTPEKEMSLSTWWACVHKYVVNVIVGTQKSVMASL
jgi:hypothetical protein